MTTVLSGHTADGAEQWQALSLNLYGALIRFQINDGAFHRWMSFLLPQARFAFTEYAEGDGRTLVDYRIEVGHPGPGEKERHYVYRNGEKVAKASARDELQWMLERAVLRETARGLSAPYQLVHSAAAARNGRGILLPAQSKSGKSTLVAALTLSGYEYYSDEIGVLTRHRTLLPFPKAITLKAGGWKVISQTFPEVQDITYHPAVGERFRHLMAPRIHPPTDAASACPVSFVISPKYTPDEKSELAPVSRAWVIGEFARRSMNWTAMGGAAYEVLVDVLRGAQCYQLRLNDLREAVGLIDRLVESPGRDALPEASGPPGTGR